MLVNDILLLELSILILLFFYTINTNLLVLLSVSGLYLTLLGVWTLLNEGDIYTGFLWVIDFGVGLIFLIFILHFTSFFFQRSNFNLSLRHYIISTLLPIFIIIIFYFFGDTIDTYNNTGVNKVWFYKVSWVDYYVLFFSFEVSELNTLKENYFYLNSYTYFIVNFHLFFGLMIVILLYFLVQRVFVYLNFPETSHYSISRKTQSTFFIRTQNFTKQQNTFPALNNWAKAKNKK